MNSYIRTPPGLYDRVVGGRAVYSHVVVAAPGDLVFISGQLSRDAEGNVIGAGDMAAQIRQVMTNLSTALAAAGASLSDLVETTTFTTDIEAYFANIDARMEFLGEDLPTSTTIGVSRLSNPLFLVEMQAIAIKRP